MVEVHTPRRSVPERLIPPGGVLMRTPGGDAASPWPAVGLLAAGLSQTAIGMGLLLGHLATLIERHQALSRPGAMTPPTVSDRRGVPSPPPP